MTRHDTGIDDPCVHVHAGKGSRPRTKDRPDQFSKSLSHIIGIGHDRYQVNLGANSTRVVTMRAYESGRGSIITGGRVHLTGDLSGYSDTFMRIVVAEERPSVLHRSLEDAPDQ